MKSLKYFCVASLFAMASCAVEKSENPLSPSVAGPIPGVEISAPKPLEPASGAQIPGDKQPVTLLLENASSNGPRPLSYAFEVATDSGFSSRVFVQEGVPPGDSGRTSLRLPDALSMGRAYYWRAKAQDGANAGPYSSPVPFNVYTPVAFDKPVLIFPINNEKVADYRPAFRIANAPHVGSPKVTSYALEIATTDSFTNKVAVWQFDETPNETRFPSAADLPPGVLLFWRVRAFESPVLGPWSDAQVFRTPTPVVITPTPGPTPVPGGSCSSQTQPFNVVKCRREQYGAHMSSDQTLAFEKSVASDLNKSTIGGGPYGVLKKSGGASCGGYACDIICTGSGSSQKQWDILGDSDGAQTPAWNGPNTGSAIRADACDVQ